MQDQSLTPFGESMKSRQFCSVCKEWLEMEVVPTSDGEEDDGVIWFRCPQCQGFLPKLSGSDSGSDKASESGDAGQKGQEKGESAPEASSAPDTPPETSTSESMPWDSPADMMAARKSSPGAVGFPDRKASQESDSDQGDGAGAAAPADPPADPPAGPGKKDEGEPAEPPEPIHEYIALLAEKDQSDPTPYRPWESYEIGQCIHHQAWEDCGVVVDKETLPGGRLIIKCFFAEAGVMRQIEKAPR